MSGCLSLVFRELADEHYLSIEKHGIWSGLTPVEMHKIISDEYQEYVQALIAGDIHGPHGQRKELLQLANVALKAYMRLGLIAGKE